MEEESTGPDKSGEQPKMDDLENQKVELELEIEKLQREYTITCMKQKYLYDTRNTLQKMAEAIILEDEEESEESSEIEVSEEEVSESDSVKTDSDYFVCDDKEGSEEEDRDYRRPVTRHSANSNLSSNTDSLKGIITRSKSKQTEVKKEIPSTNENDNDEPMMESVMLLCSLKKNPSQSSKEVVSHDPATPPEPTSQPTEMPSIPSPSRLIDNNPTIGQLPSSLVEYLNKQRPKGSYQDMSYMIPSITPLSGNEASTTVKTEPSGEIQPQPQPQPQSQSQLQSQPTQQPVRSVTSTPKPVVRPATDTQQLRTRGLPTPSPSNPTLGRSMIQNLQYNSGTPLNQAIYPQLNQQLRNQNPNSLMNVRQNQSQMKRPQPYGDMNRMYGCNYNQMSQPYDYSQYPVQQGINPVMNSPYAAQPNRMVPNRGMPMMYQQVYPMDMSNQMQYQQNMYSGVPYQVMPNGNQSDSRMMPPKMGKMDNIGMQTLQTMPSMPQMPSSNIPANPQGMTQQDTSQASKPFFIPSIATDKNGNILPSL